MVRNKSYFIIRWGGGRTGQVHSLRGGGGGGGGGGGLEWMDDLRFYVLFNSISVISGQCLDDNERLCAMELRLRMRRFHLE